MYFVRISVGTPTLLKFYYYYYLIELQLGFHPAAMVLQATHKNTHITVGTVVMTASVI
jgi:hypothetical protein